MIHCASSKSAPVFVEFTNLFFAGPKIRYFTWFLFHPHRRLRNSTWFVHINQNLHLLQVYYLPVPCTDHVEILWTSSHPGDAAVLASAPAAGNEIPSTGFAFLPADHCSSVQIAVH